MLTYYQVLELPSTATSEDIKKAWHEQLQVWHPDRFTHAPGLQRKAEARTTLINQAYQTLNDPTARQRYDATTGSTASSPPVRPHTTASPTPPPRPTTSAAPQPQPPRSRNEQRGPHLPIMLSRKNQPKIAVPAIRILVDSREHMPYIFSGLSRIAGTTRQTLQGGDYAIAEAPDIFRVERKRAEELNTIFSNPSENRQRFMRELEPLLKIPHRFLVIEGALFQRLASGRLGQYHKNGLLDFLDALTARFGLQIIYAEHRDEAEERVANLATLHYAYYYAEQEGLGRYLADNDV